MTRLLDRLWADDCGAVLTLEYLTLGSIVGLGGAVGLTSLKDTMNEEYREYGASVRDVTRAHRAPADDSRPATDLAFADRPVARMTP
jgi:hypothetical protein